MLTVPLLCACARRRRGEVVQRDAAASLASQLGQAQKVAELANEAQDSLALREIPALLAKNAELAQVRTNEHREQQQQQRHHYMSSPTILKPRIVSPIWVSSSSLSRICIALGHHCHHHVPALP